MNVISIYCSAIALITFGLPTLVQANCSCGPRNGSELHGMEYIATACPVDGDTDDTQRVYIAQSIICTNGKITRNQAMPHSEGPNTVSNIISTANAYNNTKILRNEAGTHLISAHKYYQGTVAGLTPPVGVTTHSNLNQYCTHEGTYPDADNDNFPDCLDCAPDDISLNASCPDPVNPDKNRGPRPCPTPK